ncbi:unnamed protein product [Ilex paraguariensis]|uniref:Pentatricopeptide repeat-containing protein n=1 Tax=Ilex paraguariensis TaxID=185542 RepID=A0ABC8UHN9_9AQUA
MPPVLPSSELQELCRVVSSGIGSLDDLEASVSNFSVPITASAITQVLDSCKNEAATRRLLRFFSWSRKDLGSELGDEVFNHAIRVFSEKKDFTAMDILISDLDFGAVVQTLVKLGRVDEALGIFKNLGQFKCPQDGVTITAIVSALCSKGHAKRAEGGNVKEARRTIKEMKSAGIMPDLFCFNTFLSCLCERNLKSNPSGLVPEALNVMMEMRTYGIAPTSISYNILLSCLGRTRRVKESLRILKTMRKSGCFADWVTYYLVARVLYLTGRFGKGKEIVHKMTEEGLVPEQKFYYDLIGVLCGVERVNYALELFELMKQTSIGGYGPVYDVLIPKFCRGGDFEKGKKLGMRRQLRVWLFIVRVMCWTPQSQRCSSQKGRWRRESTLWIMPHPKLEHK